MCYTNQRQRLFFVPICETGGCVLVVMTRDAMDTDCFFFFFFLLRYYYYCIALQWMWLMIIIRCFFFEWKKRISIEFFERRKCEFSMLEPLVLFVCLRNVWLFAYFPLMAHPECRYDLRLDSYTLHIDKFNNFKFFCVFFSGFKYFTRFPIRLIDW